MLLLARHRGCAVAQAEETPTGSDGEKGDTLEEGHHRCCCCCCLPLLGSMFSLFDTSHQPLVSLLPPPPAGPLLPPLGLGNEPSGRDCCCCLLRFLGGKRAGAGMVAAAVAPSAIVVLELANCFRDKGEEQGGVAAALLAAEVGWIVSMAASAISVQRQ